MNIIEIIKDAWGWCGIDPLEVVGENDFGNLIVKDINGNYWRLCPEDVYCEIIAANRAELDVLSKSQEFLADWYMSNLVSMASEKYGALEAGLKFHLVIPAILGGEYSLENIKIISLVELIQFSGDLGKQIENLPDGAQITLNII